MSSAKASPRRARARDVFALADVFALIVALVVLSGAVAGCGGVDDRPATWAFISTAIIEPGCATANCHSAIADRASVDLSSRATGYQTLIQRSFVTPGDSGRSEIIHLMRADGTLRMPPDSPLPEVDIQLIEKWIDAGAMND